MAGPSLPPGDGPYFFFSYAHTPKHDERQVEDPDIWVGKLFDKICGHIMHLTNVPQGMAGFMDRDLRPGQQWPRKLSEALATCKVFVPLYSSRYFASEDCGKEWFAFSRRMLNHAARVGEVEAIVPALWTPLRNLPEVARDIQFEHRALNETYGARGFYQIMKLNRYADDYEEATLNLAQRIIDVAEQQRVTAGAPAEYAKLENAFAGEQWDAPGPPGHKCVRFIVVAPSVSEVPVGRSPTYYGRTAEEWNPYEPETRLSLAEHAASLARTLSYRAEVGNIREDAGEILSAGLPSGPEVLLIDPWAVRYPPYLQFLEQFDKLSNPWAQVVIVCNEADRELTVARDDLFAALSATLPNRLQAGRGVSRLAVNGVPSIDDFSVVLPPVIHAAARQYVKFAGMHPPAS